MRKPSVYRPRLAGLLAALGAVVGGVAPPVAAPGAAATGAPPRVLASYVLAAPQGGSLLRAVIDQPGACPVARVDGRALALGLRQGPRTYPPRPSASGTAAAFPSAFPVSVCEAALAPGVHRVTLAGRRLPVMPAVARRIVVIGDTGCRLKASAQAWQACNDPARWPFARIAQAAAALRPDLVLHVGDYLYRENACPEGQSGCQGAAFGYGWASWQDDFLKPAAPLLAAAPWVMVRGNHEECARAGQGWWLLLDPHGLRADADCADAAQDAAGNHTDPYAVALGGHARLIVADFAALGEKHLSAAALPTYRADAAAIRALARPGDTNFVTAHYPFYALTVGKHGLKSGFASVADAFGTSTPEDETGGLPPLPHVTAMLAGHVHLLQYVARRGVPTQIVAGFSGTEEEAAEVPQGLGALAGTPLGEGLREVVGRTGVFGYALLRREAHGGWRFTAYGLDGKVMLSRLLAPMR